MSPAWTTILLAGVATFAMRASFIAAADRFAAVNGELNRTLGLKRISEATVEQLERRLTKADQWWQQASAGARTG